MAESMINIQKLLDVVAMMAAEQGLIINITSFSS